MRLTTVILIASLMQLAAATKAQKVSINKTNASLRTIIKELRSQTGFDFVYKERLLAEFKPVTIKVENTELDLVLTEIFKGQPFAFEINSKTVIVKGKEESSLLDRVVDRVSGYFANIDVSGKVLDEMGQPIGGASVVVKSTGKGVSTAADGNFYLKNVDEGAILIFKFIGYEAKEIHAVKDLGLVRLKTATNELDQVQIQAYGTTSKRLTTSNITTVRAEDIEKQPVSNPLLALQGKVPGVIINAGSGMPGATVTVRIQGYNSINSGNGPFYVIDGVPFNSNISHVIRGGDDVWGKPETPTGSNIPSYLNGESSGNPLAYINPSDIESIDILKDADATAIYGSKAANGAIIITTKRGKSGPLLIDASIKSGYNKIVQKLNYLGLTEYLEMRREAKRNNNTPILETDYDLNGFWGYEKNADYQEFFFGKSVAYNDAQLSATGGTNTASYRINLGYRGQKNVFKDELGTNQITLGTNINASSSNQRFKLALSLIGVYDRNKMPTLNPNISLLTLAPNAPSFYNADGTINWALDEFGRSTWTDIANPVSMLEQISSIQTANLNSNVLLSYDITKDLQFKTSFGFNTTNLKSFQANPWTAVQPADRNSFTRYSLFSNSLSSSYIIEPQLSYKKNVSFMDIGALLGVTIQGANNAADGVEAYGQPADSQLENLSSSPYVYPLTTILNSYRYNAGFARLNFNRNDEYLLNFTIRRDGSSRFGPDNRFENFGAVGLGWVFTQVQFIKSKLPSMSFGKFRISYGVTGNDQIGDYRYLNLYDSYNVDIPYQDLSSWANSTSRNSGLYNANLQWERTTKLNLGIDLGFFKDRVFLTSNYSINRSNNLLQLVLLPRSIGLGINAISSVYQNFPGVIKNTTFELGLTTDNIKSEKLSWTTSVNFTKFRNILESLGDKSKLVGGQLIEFPEGRSIRSIRQVPFLGVDPLVGTYRYADLNGNPTTNPTQLDKTKIVDLMPSFNGGFTNTVTYGPLSLDVLLSFQKQILGRYVSGSSDVAASYGINLRNEPQVAMQRWQKPGDQSRILKYGSIGTLGDQIYEDASFIRLKNVALSWQLPRKLVQESFLRQARFSLQMQNLYTWTGYTGLDPETGPNTLPLPRTIIFGLNIGF